MYVHLQLPAKPLAQYKAQHDSLLIHSSFIHSFRLFLYTAPLQVHYYSEALPTQHGYCVEGCATGNKGLAQGLYTRRLERDSNSRPFGRKTSTLSMSHQAPTLVDIMHGNWPFKYADTPKDFRMF